MHFLMQSLSLKHDIYSYKANLEKCFEAGIKASISLSWDVKFLSKNYLVLDII